MSLSSRLNVSSLRRSIESCSLGNDDFCNSVILNYVILNYVILNYELLNYSEVILVIFTILA